MIDNDETFLRALLDKLLRQELPAKVMVFTPAPVGALAREYPDVLFCDEKLIYRKELHELRARAAGLEKVGTIRKISSGSPFLTVIWGNPDPDAIASAFALNELVQGYARESVIAYMGEFTRPENAAMVHMLKISMRKFTRDLLKPESIVAAVDAQPSVLQGRRPAAVRHRRGPPPAVRSCRTEIRGCAPGIRVDLDDLRRVLPDGGPAVVEEGCHGAFLRTKGRHRKPHPQCQRRGRRRVPLPADAHR